MKPILITSEGLKLSVELCKLKNKGPGEWQAVITMIDPILPDARWGSVVKFKDGRLLKHEINEHRLICGELFRKVCRVFPKSKNPDPA